MFQYKSTSTADIAAKEEEFLAIAGIFEEVRNHMGFLAVQGQMKRSTEQRMNQQKEMEMTFHDQTKIGQIEQTEQLQQQLEEETNGQMNDAPPSATPEPSPRPQVIFETKYESS